MATTQIRSSHLPNFACHSTRSALEPQTNLDWARSSSLTARWTLCSRICDGSRERLAAHSCWSSEPCHTKSQHGDTPVAAWDRAPWPLETELLLAHAVKAEPNEETRRDMQNVLSGKLRVTMTSGSSTGTACPLRLAITCLPARDKPTSAARRCRVR